MLLGARVLRVSGLTRTGEEEAAFGGLPPQDVLPKRQARRWDALEKGVARCLLGLGDDADGVSIVYASRYGAMANTLQLLKEIATEPALSPTAFSMSVHNAAVGAASQLAANHGGHTALSAGEVTLAAALAECMGRLSVDEPRIVLLYSDCRMPGEYACFYAFPGDIQFACLLERDDGLAQDSGGPLLAGDETDPYRCLEALCGGAGRIVWKT